jgi:SAM-dependent methyltransferase
MIARTMRSCRLCLERGHLVPVIDLGHHPLADRFLTADQVREPEVTYPLKLRLCTACGYVGTDYMVPAPARYADPEVAYSYTAGNSAVSRAHFDELAEAIAQRVPASAMAIRGDGRLVVDVGGNDGTLLRAIKDRWPGIAVLNVEPSPAMAELAEQNGIPTHEGFLGGGLFEDASLVVTTNCLNHASDPLDFIHQVHDGLVDGGWFVIEVPSAQHLIADGAWDTIYHEHVSYFTPGALVGVLSAEGFGAIEFSENDYQGGTVRIWARKGIVGIDDNVQTRAHIASSRNTELGWAELAIRAGLARRSLTQQLLEASQDGEPVFAIGAAAKGNTLLNYCRFDDKWIMAIADSSPHKIGKYAPGSHIPIIPESQVPGRARALILPWNIAPFLRDKLAPLRLRYLRYHPQAPT